MGQKPVLSISLLASDRIDTIRKTLDSLKPIMEQIPSELILTDTSKNPKIHEILLEYTDQVMEFEWCNDFAKARNAGLALAKGEWFLYLDDDEWFVEIDELVNFFKSGEYRKYGCANYIQRNFFDRDYINYSDSWVSRMIRIDKDTSFKSKIHEYLYPQRGDIKHIYSIVYHTGYIFATEEDNRKHFERNSTLLYEMIEEEPENLRWKVQLAQEYRAVKEWEELYKFCEECLESTKHLNSRNDNYDIGTFYAGAMESLLSLKRYQEAIEVGRRALKDARNSELCLAYIYLCFGTTYYRKGDWEYVEDNIYKYLRLRKQLNKNKQLLAEQQGALLVGEALDSLQVKRAYSILIGVGLKKNDTTNLQKYLKELEWDKKIVYAFDGIVDVLAEAYGRMPLEPIFVESAQLMWNNPTLRGQLFVKIQEMESQGRGSYQQALRVLAQVSGEHWYLWYAKILVADWDHNTEHLQEYLEGFFCNVDDVFTVPEEVIQIAEKYQISVEALYLKTPFDRWKENLSDYIRKVCLNDIRITKARMQAMKTQENMRYGYLFARIAEAEVLYSAAEQDFAEKRKHLTEFAEQTEKFHRVYYQADIVSEYLELLPEYAQAAIYIVQALLLEAEEPKAALENLKLAVDVYPSLADAIKSYMKAFGAEQRQRARAAKEEMRQLQEKIKTEVYRYMEQKQYEAAIQILTQLKQLKPNDLELAELSLRIRLAMLSEAGRGE